MDDRALRRRLDGLEPDAAPDLTRPHSPAKLVEVIDLGHRPTALPGVFACREVVPGGAESEGAPVSGAGDPARPLFVTVYGSALPPAGSQMVARLVRGRWVAERGGAPGLTCSPCQIPKRDLLLTWESPAHAGESFRLVYYSATVPGNLGLSGPRWVCGPLKTVGTALIGARTTRALYNSADAGNPLRASALTGITTAYPFFSATPPGAFVSATLLCESGHIALTVATLDAYRPALVVGAPPHFFDPAYAAVDNYTALTGDGAPLAVLNLPNPGSLYASPVFDPQYPAYEFTCRPFRLRWAVRHNTALLFGLVTVTEAP